MHKKKAPASAGAQSLCRVLAVQAVGREHQISGNVGGLDNLQQLHRFQSLEPITALSRQVLTFGALAQASLHQFIGCDSQTNTSLDRHWLDSTPKVAIGYLTRRSETGIDRPQKPHCIRSLRFAALNRGGPAGGWPSCNGFATIRP